MKRFSISLLLCLLFTLLFGQANKTKTIFNKDKSFTIVSFKKGITNQSSSTDTAICKDWKIEKKYLPRIIQYCNFISGTGWDLSFDVLPCIISGELKQGGRVYKYEMNAGSWLYIKSADTTMILGNYKKAHNRFFISSPE